MEKPVLKSYIALHVATFLFGFTAILGKLISLSAFMLVWWRVLITSISLLFIINAVQLFKRLDRKTIFQFMGIGALIAFHWVTFYGSIKLANASITLICMATISLFTAIIEPLIMKQPVKWYEILLGLLIIPGMLLIVQGTQVSMLMGIWVGIFSAFLAALFGSLNKKLISKASTFEITFIELSSAWLFLSLVLPFYLYFSPEKVQFMPSQMDWLYIIVLSLLCTTLAYVLFLQALQHISAFASNLTVNLEPVYGILMAWFFLNEHEEVSPNFYWGVALILIVVFSYPLIKMIYKKRKSVDLA